MDVLLTTTQLADHGDRFRAAAPDARFLAMTTDGTVHDGDRVLAPDDVTPEIAFGSTDLFDADRDDTIGHFFGHLLRAESLVWLHMAAAGVDHRVFGMLLDRGVRLTTSHHTAIPISEYVLAQVLRARLPLDAMETDRAERRWRTLEWDELASSRWLVVGVGAIGTAVAERARAFGAGVTGVRRRPTGDEPVDAMIGPADLGDAVADHDVIVLSVPATRTTAGMVDATVLDRLSPGTILVNVGRGALIDEDDLRTGLDHGRPATAILDVTATEPPPDDHWLWDHPSVVMTAHTSAGGRQRRERAADVFGENLRRWSSGQPLLDEVTPEDRDPPTDPPTG